MPTRTAYRQGASATGDERKNRRAVAARTIATALLRAEAGIEDENLPLGRYGKPTRQGLIDAWNFDGCAGTVTYTMNKMKANKTMLKAVLSWNAELVQGMYDKQRPPPTEGASAGVVVESPFAGISKLSPAAARTEGYKRGTKAVESKSMTSRQASKRLRDKGVNIAHMTLHRGARDRPGMSPPMRGEEPALDTDVEDRICEAVLAMRELKLPVARFHVLAWATLLVRDTPAAENFKDGVPSYGWYQRFMTRSYDRGKLRRGTDVVLDMDRATWTTSGNLRSMYNTQRDVLLAAGVATKNPSYDPTNEESEELLITRPDLLASYDETRFQLNMKENVKTARVLSFDPADRGEVLSSTAKCECTAIVGSLANGATLPPMLIFAGTIPVAEPDAYPRSTISDGNGGTKPCILNCNRKGSNDSAMALEHFEKVLKPLLAQSPSSGLRGVVFCDGCGTHLSVPLIRAMREAGVDMVLRCPHTSHKTNTEDVVTFGVAKPEFRKMKRELLAAKMLNAGCGYLDISQVDLKPEDMPALLKGSLEKAYTPALNRSGWKKCGVYPFTRCVEVQLRAEEEVRAKRSALALERARAAKANSLADVDTSMLDALTHASHNALNIIRARKEKAAQLECGDATGFDDNDNEDGADKENAPAQKRQRRGLTAKNVWNTAGGITGDTAYSKLEAEQSKRDASAKEAEKRRADNADAKAQKVQKQNAQALELLESFSAMTSDEKKKAVRAAPIAVVRTLVVLKGGIDTGKAREVKLRLLTMVDPPQPAPPPAPAGGVPPPPPPL